MWAYIRLKASTFHFSKLIEKLLENKLLLTFPYSEIQRFFFQKTKWRKTKIIIKLTSLLKGNPAEHQYLRWPIDDTSHVPRFFWKKDEPLVFPTVISSGNMFTTVITSGNPFPTVITSGNVFSTVIPSDNLFPTFLLLLLLLIIISILCWYVHIKTNKNQPPRL